MKLLPKEQHVENIPDKLPFIFIKLWLERKIYQYLPY